MTFRISAVAVCRSSASLVSLNRCAFWIAITAWSAKLCCSASSSVVKGTGRSRYAMRTPIALPSRRSGVPAITRVPSARAGARPGQSAIEGSTLSISGMWICRFSSSTVPGRLWAPIRSSAAGTSAPIRFELAPTRMVWAHCSLSAIWSVTLGAPNRRAVVSAICCSACPASPDAPAMARRISALPAWRSRAVRNSVDSRAFSSAVAACCAIASSRSAKPDWSFCSSSAALRLRSASTSCESAVIQLNPFRQTPGGTGPNRNDAHPGSRLSAWPVSPHNI